MSRSLLNKRHSSHVTRDSKVMTLFTSQQIKHLLKKMCQKSKMDTTIDFVKTPNIQEITPSWKPFRKIIWNRRIITLVVCMIKLDEKTFFFKKKYLKIKQVSSTKLTNWYKNISLWKTNRFFHRLIFLDVKLKVSKILLQSLRASFQTKRKIIYLEIINQVRNTGT